MNITIKTKEEAQVSLEELFCRVDDFCMDFMEEWETGLIEDQLCKKTWSCQLAASEIMTIMILFHQSHYRNFKHFYLGYIQLYYRSEFPNLLSYSRFVEQKQRIVIGLDR